VRAVILVQFDPGESSLYFLVYPVQAHKPSAPEIRSTSVLRK